MARDNGATLHGGIQLFGPNEFWLALHRVSSSYRDEGLTSDERQQAILVQFRGMPAIARRELLTDFALVAFNFQDLYTACLAAQHEIEEPQPKKADAGAA